MGKSLGDLEYQKFDENGVVKITEQSPRQIEYLIEQQIFLLEDIRNLLQLQINYLKEFFEDGILDDDEDDPEL